MVQIYQRLTPHLSASFSAEAVHGCDFCFGTKYTNVNRDRDSLAHILTALRFSLRDGLNSM